VSNTNTIATRDQRDLTFGSCRLTACGIVFDSRPTFEEWEAAGTFIQRAEGAVQWWVGDWLLHGDCRPEWGDKYEQAISLFGKDYQTLKNYKWVAQSIELSRRRDNLSWGHHEAVAALPLGQREELLSDAEQEELPVAEVRKRARRLKATSAEPPKLPPGTYSLILADPPWGFDGASDAEHVDGNGRSTMTVEAIKAFPAATVAALDCLLFVWASQPRLADALDVIRAWGFTYRSGFVWDRQRVGMGDYVRVRTEHLLLGVKGRPPLPARESRVENLISAPRGDGRRPDVFYELLESLFPNATRLELFATAARSNWKAWPITQPGAEE
jgi:N6-adenosine-specific RNA methylase IME4